MRSRSLTTFTILLLVSNSAQTQDAQLEYRPLQQAQAALKPIAGTRYLRPTLRLDGPGFARARGAVTLTLKTLAQDITVRVDANGNFDLPDSHALIEENPQIWVNLGKSDSRLDYTSAIKIEAPAVREFDYQLIASMRDELKRSQAQRGIMSRFFAPSMRGVLIDFGAPGRYRAQVSTAGTTRTVDSDADGYLRLPADDRTIATQAKVTLSAMPSAIRLELE